VAQAPPLTLGTAGHIDHGKTALVRALTGTDTDRLPEERERGISIALGYARVVLPSGRAMSVVDVPGHERFVRTMVAGASGIDAFLAVVAADDGPMPQTREHAAVLAALGVEHGVVAITKSDLADPGQARGAAAELFPEAELVAVSSRVGSGLGELREALDRLAARLPSRSASEGPARLHVDRAFTIRGAGTVVTGTLWSGSVGRGDELELAGSGRTARVRAVEVHGTGTERATAGQRVALNLAGVELRAVGRGVLLAAPGAVDATWRLDAALRWRDPAVRPAHGDRLQAHHGTREVPARLAELGGRFWQLRLEAPLAALAGDRLVLRRVSPPDTLGGGVVLDAAPRRHGPSRDLLARLERLERGEREEPVGELLEDAGVEHSGSAGRDADALPAMTAAALDCERVLLGAWLEPPQDSVLEPAHATALPVLRANRRAFRIGRGMHVHAAALAELRATVVSHLEARGTISLAELRDMLGSSRRYAQAFLERLDSERVTRREGDVRVLRRGPRTS